LTKREFRRSLRLGLGRAILYAHHHPIDRFYNEILDACLTDDVYDHQVEEGRDPYLFEIADLHPRRKQIYDEIVAALPANEGVWSLVAELAKRKHPKAKQALYANFNPTPEFGPYYAIDLVAVDGLIGFRGAVKKLALLDPTDAEVHSTRYFVDESRELLGSTAIDAELKRLGKLGLLIQERVRRANLPDPPEPKLPDRYVDLAPRLISIDDWKLKYWGKKATPKELRRAAKGLLNVETPTQRLAHLRLFLQVRFPLPVRQLLNCLPGETENISWAIHRVLSQCRHRSLRNYALELLALPKAGKARLNAVEMLLNNSRRGDLEIARKAFEAERSRWSRHNFGQDIVDYCKANPQAPGATEALLSVYENSPCTMCRRRSVEILLADSALPDSLRAECAYDCTPRIRELVKT
jgi:hypothetical protein